MLNKIKKVILKRQYHHQHLFITSYKQFTTSSETHIDTRLRPLASIHSTIYFGVGFTPERTTSGKRKSSRITHIQQRESSSFWSGKPSRLVSAWFHHHHHYQFYFHCCHWDGVPNRRMLWIIRTGKTRGGKSNPHRNRQFRLSLSLGVFVCGNESAGWKGVQELLLLLFIYCQSLCSSLFSLFFAFWWCTIATAIAELKKGILWFSGRLLF